MSLVAIHNISSDVTLGLWRFDEAPDEILNLNPNLRKVVELYHGNSRKLEVLAVYMLMYEMLGKNVGLINHLPSGKPYVDGWNISISHTKGYAVLIASKTKNVSVDIEYLSARVSRVVNKFVRDDEQAATIEQQLVNWSAKETTYKYFSDENLQYFDMRLLPFAVVDNGIVIVQNLKSGTNLEVHYEINPEYVLSYAI